jgi:hypothetical protein
MLPESHYRWWLGLQPWNLLSGYQTWVKYQHPPVWSVIVTSPRRKSAAIFAEAIMFDSSLPW